MISCTINPSMWKTSNLDEFWADYFLWILYTDILRIFFFFYILCLHYVFSIIYNRLIFLLYIYNFFPQMLDNCSVIVLLYWVTGLLKLQSLPKSLRQSVCARYIKGNWYDTNLQQAHLKLAKMQLSCYFSYTDCPPLSFSTIYFCTEVFNLLEKVGKNQCTFFQCLLHEISRIMSLFKWISLPYQTLKKNIDMKII